MANITKTQLRQRIAEHLRVYSPDVELSADLASRIDTSIDDARAELMELGLCWWGEDAIPQSVALPMTLIVSAQACIKVGKMGQGYESGDGDGRTRLSRLKGTMDIGTMSTDFF